MMWQRLRFALAAWRPAPVAGPLEMLGKPGSHERRISGLCGGRMRYDGDGPVFAAPLVIIAFTNRSGSNLLAEYVAQAGRAARAGEMLNADTVERRGASAEEGGLPGYISQLEAEKAGPGRSLALKASWAQLAMLIRGNIPAMFPGTVLLHVERADLLRQAVSFRLAQQSGRWTSRHSGGRAPKAEVIPPEAVLRTVTGLQQANLRIRLIAEAAGLGRWPVSYEAMSADPAGHLPPVLQAAGLAAPDWRPDTPRLEKQAGPENAALVEAVLAAVRERL